MNIIEAAKTGMPMRRNTGEPHHHYIDPMGSVVLNRRDILAEDWEVDEPKVTITRRDLEKAVKTIPHNEESQQHALYYIAKELGL